MGEVWLDGFTQVETRHSGTSSYWLAGCAPKWCGHTVEGYARDSVGAFAAHPWEPHTWVTLPSHPWAPRLRLQGLSLDRPAYALEHPAGTPETNRAGVIQTEIEGWAREAADWSTTDLDWLADEVVAPICEACAIDPSTFTETHLDGVVLASVSSPLRLAPGPEFYAFGGLLFHVNVPDNSHWDAPVRLAYLSARIRAGGGTPPPPPPPPPNPTPSEAVRYLLAVDAI